MREWIEINSPRLIPPRLSNVLPRMREWIEIYCHYTLHGHTVVLPRMREWIEMMESIQNAYNGFGSPSYEGVD